MYVMTSHDITTTLSQPTTTLGSHSLKQTKISTQYQAHPLKHQKEPDKGVCWEGRNHLSGGLTKMGVSLNNNLFHKWNDR